MLKLIPDVIKLPAAGLAGAILCFAVFTTINAVWSLPRAEQRGRDLEAAELTAATNKAIGELSNAADQARVRRRLCRERSGVYDFAKGECIEGQH
jgi:hypothetical protein